jgi:hypothetical protein
MSGPLWAQIAVFGMLLWLFAFAINLRENAGVGVAALAACIMAPLALIVLAVVGGALYGIGWTVSVAVGS